MNSEDVFSLVRSGSLFGALSPDSARDLHILRRRLCIDCPNTYVELQVNDDQSIARGQDMDGVLRTVLDNLKYPRVEHYSWKREDAADSLIAVEEDPFYVRGCVLHTVPRRIDYRFHQLAITTPCETKTVDASRITHLHRATGLSLNTICVLEKSLCRRVRHRCSIQIMSLPQASAAAATSSPQRQLPSDTETKAMSPSKLLAVEHFENKSFTPHCCFGIYCPSLPEEPQINSLLQHRAPFTSRRWLGVYWSDGTSVPTLGILGSVTTSGVMRSTVLQGRPLVRVGDILTIETRPDDDSAGDGTAGTVLFFVNNVEVGRVTSRITMPIATNVDDCYFGVRLSEGASVATFTHQL